MIKFLPGRSSLSKNQFVYLISQTMRDLPYTLHLESCCAQYPNETKNENATLGEVWTAVMANGRGFIEVAILAEDLTGETDDIFNVSITMEVIDFHLWQPSALVKDLTQTCATLVAHEIQEYIGRNTKLDRIIPHGTDKLHLVPDWVEYAEN